MKLFKKNYYEKLFAKPKKTVQDYQLIAMHAQEKIQELQNMCSHEHVTAMMYSWRPGAMQPSYVCSACSKYIGEASEEVSKKLWDEFHGNNPQAVSFDHPTTGTYTLTNVKKGD
jgi:hypothetical protein